MAHPAFTLEDSAISPLYEMGAFEALWAKGNVSSFNQLHQKLTSSEKHSLSELAPFKEAEMYYLKAIALLKNAPFGIRIVDTVDYPKALLDGGRPLPLLYFQGDWDLVYSPAVAVVGTRRPSEDGIKRTNILVKQLIHEGFTIFSGLASGIDTAAHQAAIHNGGKTVAVIGTPLWMVYPKENASLQAQIAKQHLLISQVPLVAYQPKNLDFTRQFFPERNKTMAALTQATIIIEAGETSGSLIQAKAALRLGRKVFILNNNFENKSLTWPAKLEAVGAIRVKNIEDILQGLECVQVTKD